MWFGLYVFQVYIFFISTCSNHAIFLGYSCAREDTSNDTTFGGIDFRTVEIFQTIVASAKYQYEQLLSMNANFAH